MLLIYSDIVFLSVPLTVLFSEPFLRDLELIWSLHKTININLI